MIEEIRYVVVSPLSNLKNLFHDTTRACTSKGYVIVVGVHMCISESVVALSM